jgi:hypothetical protein
MNENLGTMHYHRIGHGVPVWHEPHPVELSKWDEWLKAQKERHPSGAVSLHKRLLKKRYKVTATL